jgi:hypothetical protein
VNFRPEFAIVLFGFDLIQNVETISEYDLRSVRPERGCELSQKSPAAWLRQLTKKLLSWSPELSDSTQRVA